MPKSPPRVATRAASVVAVLDTNVVVSGFLKSGSTPARLLALIPAGVLVPVYSDAIEAEYREVLRRPKFAIEPRATDAFLASLHNDGLRVTEVRRERLRLPDPDDYPFVAAARAAMCPVVTGNLRHFPASAGVEAISPARFFGHVEL